VPNLSLLFLVEMEQRVVAVGTGLHLDRGAFTLMKDDQIDLAAANSGVAF